MFYRKHNIWHFTKERRGDNELFDLIRFVVEACSKDDTKAPLQCMLSTGDKLYATDGHRMHIAHLGDNKGIFEPDEKTLYFPIKVTKTIVSLVTSDCEDDFPDFNRARNTALNNEHSKNVFDGMTKTVSGINSLSAIFKMLPEGKAINPRLLKGMEFAPNDEYTITVSESGLNPVRIFSDKVEMIVMPMRN